MTVEFRVLPNGRFVGDARFPFPVQFVERPIELRRLPDGVYARIAPARRVPTFRHANAKVHDTGARHPDVREPGGFGDDRRVGPIAALESAERTPPPGPPSSSSTVVWIVRVAGQFDLEVVEHLDGNENGRDAAEHVVATASVEAAVLDGGVPRIVAPLVFVDRNDIDVSAQG